MLAAVSPLLAAVGGLGAFVDAIKQAAALLALVVVLALAVLIKAGPQLRTVRAALAGDVPRALALGVALQLAWLPALLLACVLCALTVLGIVLVPFVALGWIALTIGLAVLGLTAVAEMLGAALGRGGPQRGLTERGARLQALITGLLVLAAPALASSVLAGVPYAAGILRALAVGLAWVAMTAGLGAVAMTRAGTVQPGEPWGFKRRAAGGAAYVPAGPSEWVTPTPITGVVAARRPVAASRDG